MKKAIAVGTFILAVIITIVPVSYMLRPSADENGEYRRRMTGFYAEQEDSLNMVVLGSSALYRYVDNILLWKEKGITSYNFCSPSQSIFALEYLVEEVEKTQSPDLYIVDARQFIFNGIREQKEEKLRQLIDNMKYSINRYKIINKNVPSWKDRLSYYFDIILYHDEWENLMIDSLEYIDNEKKHPLMGWSIINVIKDVGTPKGAGIGGELPIQEDAEQELRYLLDLWKKQDKEILFLCTPWVIDEENQQKSNYMKRIVEEEGFRYLDANLYQEELDLNYSKDFYNDRHVNAAGAVKFSRFLGEYLTQEFQFTKIQEESVVKEWKAAEEYYDNQMGLFMEQYNTN